MGCNHLRSFIKEEFQWKHFWLNHHNDRDFYCCQWRIPHPLYVLVRLCLAGYSAFALVDILRPGRGAVFVLQQYRAFTIWSYTVLTLHLLLACILSIVFFRHSTRGQRTQQRTVSTLALTISNNHGEKEIESPEMFQDHTITNPNYDSEIPGVSIPPLESSPYARKTRWFFKLSTILGTVASVSAFIVTVVFFVFLYHGPYVTFKNANVHALNLAFVCIDHVICARPVRVVQVYLAAIWSAAYLLFTLCYFWRTHKFVYPILDPNHPGQFTLMFVCLVVAALVVHVSLAGWYRLKLGIFRKIHGIPPF